MILVALTDGAYGPKTFSFTRETIAIGSAGDCDLVLAAPRVARRHVVVTERPGALRVEDARSQLPPRMLGPTIRIKVAALELNIAIAAFAPEDVHDDVERTLLDAIRDNPRDPATREVYADWLEGNGHAARAEFLRVQLAGGPSARLAELAPGVGVGWRARVATTPLEKCNGGGDVKFEVVCPKRWDQLEPTAQDGVRMCRACQEPVTYCASMAHARALAQAGRCIAIDVTTPRARDDLERPMMVGRASPEVARYGRPRGG